MNGGMVFFDVRQLAEWAGGTCEGAVREVRGVTQDTRRMPPGCLYVALRGERFDGHDFVLKAFEGGAAAVLVEGGAGIFARMNNHGQEFPCGGAYSPCHLGVIRVADTRRALQDIARAWRARCGAKVIGVTGSAGKTTVKEMLAACCSGAGPVCATQGNLNNDIGLPLSLLTMPQETAFGVFETGTNHPGEIARLADILRPQGAVVSSVGRAHIEFFGSVKAIAREKGELLRVLPQDGFAVLCKETAHFRLLAEMSSAPVVTVSLKTRSADFFGKVLDEMTGRVRVTERASGACVELASGLPGAHNASNLLLAFAAARCAGVTAEAAAEGMRGFTMPGKRWEVQVRNGVTIVNDAYNANPDSMRMALETFMRMPCKGRRIAVLGDMFELGDHAEAAHREVGKKVAMLNPDFFCAVGDRMRGDAAQEAVAAGFPAARVLYASTKANAAKLLSYIAQEGDSVLLKASRGMALEEVLEKFEVRR